MRKVLAITLTVAMAIVGSSFTSAQAQMSAGSIAGRAVNASGRALAGQRIDLVRGAQVVNVATTSTQGDWTFQNVTAGDYVVRTSLNGRIAGTRVTVAAGQAVTGTMIVAPTAAVSPQFGAFAGIIGNALTAAGAAATSVATTAGVETEEVSLNAEQVAAIFNQLTPTQQVAFATAVTQALQESGNLTSSGSGSSGTGGGSGNVFVPVQTTETASSTNTQSNPAQNALLVSALVTIANGAANNDPTFNGSVPFTINVPSPSVAADVLGTVQAGNPAGVLEATGGGVGSPPLSVPITTIVTAS